MQFDARRAAGHAHAVQHDVGTIGPVDVVAILIAQQAARRTRWRSDGHDRHIFEAQRRAALEPNAHTTMCMLNAHIFYVHVWRVHARQCGDSGLRDGNHEQFHAGVGLIPYDQRLGAMAQLARPSHGLTGEQQTSVVVGPAVSVKEPNIK